MKKQINVVGIGPGHPDWLLPIARQVLEASDVVIGGRRQLAELQPYIKASRLLEGNYSETAGWILDHADTLRISVAVSGDTGFHSLLGYLKKNLPGVSLKVYPGVGSLQYFFGRLGLTWEQARLVSAHGRELAWDEIGPEDLVGILTDTVTTPAAIASELSFQGKGDIWMAVGENLSYANETITLERARDIQDQLFEPLNAVLILPEPLALQVKEAQDERE